MMLRTSLAHIHRDPQWWQKILIGGALMLTLLGYPLAVGMVTESMDNSRKGFPTPLPPWYEWSTRYLLGLLTSLIDFIFFVLPIFVAALLTFCVSLAVITSSSAPDQVLRQIIGGVGTVIGLLWVLLFFSSVAPVARLVYIAEGQLATALGSEPLRRAWSRSAWRVFFRARLLSLVAYIPALLLGVLLFLFLQQSFAIVVVLLLWLWCSALLYAHLVVAQLYVAAEQQLGTAQRMDRHPVRY